MEQNKQSKPVRWQMIVLIILAVIAVGLLIWYALQPVSVSTDRGKTYLKDQETRDITDINTQLQTVRAQEISEAISEGKLDVFSLFQDYVMLGDSRVSGFDVFGFLESSRVLADLGNTILTIDDRLEEISSLQPSTVYISYGTNDLESQLGYYDGVLDYKSLVSEQISKVSSLLPNATIVVNSIIGVSDGTLAADSKWEAIKDYNEQIKEACEENGWIFVDNSKFDSKYMEAFYAEDGLHFDSSFYPLWAKNMIETVQNHTD